MIRLASFAGRSYFSRLTISLGLICNSYCFY